MHHGKNMLNIPVIQKSSICPDPFPYIILNNLLCQSDVESLVTSVPSGSNQRIARAHGSDKTYRNTTNVLLELGSDKYNNQNELSESWIHLLDVISSRKYRILLSQHFGAEIIECQPEITLRKYQHKDYISAHTDRDCVHATQLIFLNTFWQESWGGMLHFMSDEKNDVINFLPHYATSIVFLRTDNSWHRVSEVSKKGVERIALQIAFWKKTKKVIYDGRQIINI